MSRTVRELLVIGRDRATVERFLASWFADHGFQLAAQISQTPELTFKHWDGSIVIRPRPGSTVFLRIQRGGATIVLEFTLAESGSGTGIHLEGYVTGRGYPWKGKENEFSPTALAVAGVPRKAGFRVLAELQSDLELGAATAEPLPSSSRPVPSLTGRSGPAGADAPSPAVTKGRPYRFSDHSLARKAFPYTLTTHLAPIPTALLQQRLAQTITELGFEVVLDTPPLLDGKPMKPSRFDRHKGLVVGEKNLRTDPSLRRRAWWTLGISATAGVFLGGSMFWLISLGYRLSPVLPILTGTMFAVALISTTSTGSFDSDIVWIEYSPGTLTTGGLTDGQRPVEYSLLIGSGTVTSRNWAGKGASGRNVKALKPPAMGLSELPNAIAGALRETVDPPL